MWFSYCYSIFNFVWVREHTLYEFSPLKFVHSCLMPDVCSLLVYVPCVLPWENVYQSLVEYIVILIPIQSHLLIMLVKSSLSTDFFICLFCLLLIVDLFLRVALIVFAWFFFFFFTLLLLGAYRFRIIFICSCWIDPFVTIKSVFILKMSNSTVALKSVFSDNSLATQAFFD